MKIYSSEAKCANKSDSPVRGRGGDTLPIQAHEFEFQPLVY